MGGGTHLKLCAVRQSGLREEAEEEEESAMADTGANPNSGNESDEENRKVKKLKGEPKGDRGENGEETNLSDFKPTSVLRDSARDKTIFVHGELKEQPAVVILEKTPFGEDTLTEMFKGAKTNLEVKNDIYSTYVFQPPAHLNEIKATVVCPATEAHVQKYQRKEIIMVEETEDDYKNITLPYITSKGLSVTWVYNILEKKAEKERIIFEDSDKELGFVLLPDFKWDQKQVDDLYLIAIVHKRDIKSLRDLTPDHLQLLQNIYQKGTDAIVQRYGLPTNKLRVYVHYQPSYYHFHVHFNSLSYEVPGSRVERAHLLQDIIQNLKSDPQYYKTRTLLFPMRTDDELISMYKAAGRL
ncbi:m7GpppX diphosphatase-like isoform X2 [Myripristis murdjan]|uniref:m7GpppX diphosphatase-like isoform X2 n=1 Tax=Myripristis murdjan TaxID=586833 RepID=UPI001176244F|nr:m7GpppX diphosphatase-like isoform X2 [Myripristis murdjan]